MATVAEQPEKPDPRIERAARVAVVVLWLFLPAAGLYAHRLDAHFLTLTAIGVAGAWFTGAFIRALFREGSILMGSAAAFVMLGEAPLKYLGISDANSLLVGWFAVVMLPLGLYAHHIRRHGTSTGAASMNKENS